MVGVSGWFNYLFFKMGYFFITGRVHSAIVAAINHDLRSATVEWFENNETKGKEVDMTTIQSLNPDVVIVKPTERYIQESAQVNQSPINNLQRVSNFCLFFFAI